MPGSIENTDLLAGINQLVKAINDLVLVSNCDPVTNVSNNVQTPNITVNCCSSGGGSKLEDEPVDETDTPPPGFEPDPNIDNRKCKAVNFYYDGVREVFYRWDIDDVQDKGALGFTVVTTLIGAALGTYFPIVGNLIGAVAGAIIGITIAILVAGASPGDMLAIWDANQEEIICALYSATNTTQAKDDVLAICDAGGMSTAEWGIVAWLLSVDGLRVLYQALPGSEAALDGYVSAVDCAECGGGCGADIVYFASYEGFVCGALVSGCMDGLGTFIARSTVAPAFGDNRKCIRLSPEIEGQNIRYSLTVIETGEEGALFLEYIDTNNDYQGEWLTTLPSFVDAKLCNLIGFTIGGGGPEFRIEYTLEVI